MYHKGEKMRTTLDLPEDLLKEALRVSHARTKTMAIVLGLKELIHRYQIDELRSLRGKVSIKFNRHISRSR